MSPTFENLGLPSALVDELKRQMRTEPFPIQLAAIPDVLRGHDVLGRAPTGSGKTLAFGLPTLARVGKATPRAPRALVLSPTRELAQQIRTELSPLANAVGRSVTAVYGGTGFEPQIKALNGGADVLVATPGRLEDLINQRKVTLSQVDIVIIDEADRMADMGFLPSVRLLVDMTCERRQMILFSATLDEAVQVLVDDYLNNPVSHSIGSSSPDVAKSEHRFWKLDKTERIDRAAQVVDEYGSTIIFCRTRHGVDRVARQLKMRGVKAAWIHGGRTQGQRNAALHAFTAGKARALVATDVAARGIHVDDVACVLHYDPPADHKDYLHRSGRTARAGGSGVVFSFLLTEQTAAARKLQSNLNLRSDIVNPPALPEWIKENSKAWSKSGAKSTRQRSKKASGSRTQANSVAAAEAGTATVRFKANGNTQANAKAKLNQKSKPNENAKSNEKAEVADKAKATDNAKPTERRKKPKAKSSRTGRKRPANRNGGRRKPRGSTRS